MRIGVFGCGAIGGVIAGYLARAGRDIVAVDPWFVNVERIRRDGLQVKAIEETFTSRPRVLHLEEFAEAGTVDVAIVATKAYDTAWMARLVEPLLARDGTALSAQNGMNEQTLVEVFGPERVIGCVVPYSAGMFEPACVERTSSEEWGSLILGELGGPVSDRVRAIVEALEPVTGMATSETIREALWGKMTLNVMGNVLAGLSGYTTRLLWTDDAALDVQIALAHEIAMLARHEGVVPDPVLKTVDHELLAEAEAIGDPNWEEAKARVAAVGETRVGAKENVPSLLQDIQKGRRTEVSHLNGWVARKCEAAGLQAPVNAAVADAGRAREMGDLGSDPANLTPLRELVEQLHGGARTAT
jgi:2-dehydropantoate 2-reductase